MSDLKIKEASLEDMEFILSLARDEGWNPGIHDALPFYSADPKGFFIGEIGSKKIGCISVVAYNECYSFLGFYIVVPEYRGKGYGLELWNHGIQHLGNRTIGLDGVIAQQAAYERSSFELYYRNIRYQGTVKSQSSNLLVDAQTLPLESLVQYDKPIFGVERKRFLDKWINNSETYSLAKTGREGLLGYGTIRKCGIGWKIGPLFADDISIAKELFEGLCYKTGGAPVFLDIPEINNNALELVQHHSMQKVFETVRMYKGTPPAQRLEKVFGVTTYELG